MGPSVYFIHSAALPSVYLSPCVYMSLALIRINTVHVCVCVCAYMRVCIPYRGKFPFAKLLQVLWFQIKPLNKSTYRICPYNKLQGKFNHIHIRVYYCISLYLESFTHWNLPNTQYCIVLYPLYCAALYCIIFYCIMLQVCSRSSIVAISIGETE